MVLASGFIGFVLGLILSTLIYILIGKFRRNSPVDGLLEATQSQIVDIQKKYAELQQAFLESEKSKTHSTFQSRFHRRKPRSPIKQRIRKIGTQ